MFVTYAANKDQGAILKRVMYEGTDTIYEGMALCYNFDTTTNVNGLTVPTTAGITAEGYQNEGKFYYVEKPATANLKWFAGVVARGSWCGTAGPVALDIYIPNGSIVPVRSSISSTVGVHALGINNGSYALGDVVNDGNGSGRVVGIAMETVDRSSTNGICLAKLCPDAFLYDSAGTAKMVFNTSAGTAQTCAHFINAKSLQTSGNFTALFVRSEVTTAGAADIGSAVYGECNVLGVASGSTFCGNRFSLNLWGGTQTAQLFGACCEVYEQDANLTGITCVAPLWLRTQIDATNPPAAGSHWQMYISCDGADKPDGLFFASALTAIGAYASTSDAPALATGDIMIPIKIGASTYHLVALVDAGV